MQCCPDHFVPTFSLFASETEIIYICPAFLSKLMRLKYNDVGKSARFSILKHSTKSSCYQVTMGINLCWTQINRPYGFIVSFLWNSTKSQSKEFKR